MKYRSVALGFLAGVYTAMSLWLLTGCQQKQGSTGEAANQGPVQESKASTPVKWNGMDIAGAISPQAMKSWSLLSTRKDGERLGVKDFPDKAVLVFFGYTQCPDICPLTLAKLARVIKQLTPEEQQRVQVLFITVDPERDTLEFMKRYVKQFNEHFIGLRGTPPEIRQVADTFKIFFQKTPLSGGGYSVDHSAGVFMIDSHAQAREIMPDSLTDAQIKADIQQLIHL